jgi:small-conductance mechanosensitive channel
MSGVLSLIGQIFKPAMEMIDNVHTSTEEKLEQKAHLLDLQTKFLSDALDYEQEQLKQRGAIIVAEAKSDSWLTKSWRPITMLTFLCLVVFDSFGWLPSPLAQEAWTLLQLGIGGYIVGRSAQGVASSVTKALKAKEQV